MAAQRSIGPETAENSVRRRPEKPGAPLTRDSACQLPPECPDIEWPVEPNPPRGVLLDPLRETEVPVEVEPLRLPDSAVETEVGARRAYQGRDWFDDE
jgi:hypothetical protein